MDDVESLMLIADNIEKFWGDIAARCLPGVEYDAHIAKVAANEAQHLREIAARLRGNVA